MDVKGIGSHNIINVYNKNANNKVVSKEVIKQSTDRIEISSLGKSLTDFSLEGLSINDPSKIAELKNKVESGNYNVDAKLTAKSMINYIKETKIK
ncbi:flagellar biosynthesis anti-sigma factor FlgM [Clostridium vincentii]|uniref:Negative regulator of flagellin synthesis n=1 Tax=Clostridium vincentii TaxID=52704 RepID=A0A2T0BG02_9CLOT|nr:flagellar biosynthesis anti-sigma factor FlgM [Clostridium vincentii]PRR82831.1 Anti-sigma-28 factor, FlgM [Clostridium vincentii]